jgi:hypothetical protein
LALHAPVVSGGDSSASRSLLQGTITCNADIPSCKPGRCTQRDLAGDLVSARQQHCSVLNTCGQQCLQACRLAQVQAVLVQLVLLPMGEAFLRQYV